ncbi:hypothetical protein M407DRAFT_25529 [Tulasnella calospora MUT 4182]|uniref:Uncharacterized protein n=1 Tax=Tulasnella calospora MUT 4182 TaxID=1051891 RepID=A0A0C3LUL0_9AGAM|nr:hypothetical protein M407DRAFT_25529 [Tulasnella calospora MUT 4182]
MAKIEQFWTRNGDEETPSALLPSTLPPPLNPPAPKTTPDVPPKKESPPTPPPKTLIEFPALSPTKQTQQEKTLQRKRTFAETAAKPAPTILEPPQGGSRPLRKAAENVTDYFDGKRRTTKPAPQRKQVVDQGGEENKSDHDESAPPPGAFPLKLMEAQISESEDDKADIDAALKATPIVESLAYVYGENDDFLSWKNAHQIGLRIALEKALSTATQPKDSPKGWREAMTSGNSEMQWNLGLG